MSGSVLDFCRGDLVWITAETTLVEAARLMDDRCVGFLLVANSSNEIGFAIGVLTDRDLVIRGVARDLDFNRASVRQVMSIGPISIGSTSSVGEVLSLMTERQVRRVLIQAADGKAIGVVSVDDLVKRIGEEASALKSLIERQTGTPARHRTHEFTKMA